MMNKWLNPDWEPGIGVQSIPHQILIKKGIKALFLDVDGTLIQGRRVIIHQSVIDWVTEAKKYQFIHLVSNNPSKKRIESIANRLGITYTNSAAKPSSKAIKNKLKDLNLKPSQIAIIGDRIFTDVLVGNRLGFYTILVKPLDLNGQPVNNLLQQLEKCLAKIIGGSVK